MLPEIMQRIITRFSARKPSGDRNARRAAQLALVLMENLEQRRLLSSNSYPVPSGVSDVYLSVDPDQVHIDVHHGALTNPVVAQLDGAGTSSTDTITASVAGVKLHDFVPVAGKPAGGIFFQGASGSTFDVHAADADRLIKLTSSSGSGGTVTTTDTSDPNFFVTGLDSWGAGVSHLVLNTNNVAATSYDTGDGTEVDIPAIAPTMSLLINTGAATFATINIGGGEGGVINTQVITGAGNDRVNVVSDEGLDGVSSAAIDFGPGTGSGTGVGLGNSLFVDSTCAATLAHVAGGTSSGVPTVVDSVDVHNSGTLVTADATTIGDLEIVASIGAAQINGPTTIETFNDDGVADFTAPATVTNLNVGHIALFTGTAPSTIGTLTNNGLVTFQSPTTASTITGDGATHFTSTAGSSTVGTLTYLDAGNGVVTIDSGASVTITDVMTVNELHLTGDLLLREGTVWKLNTAATMVLENGSGAIAGIVDIGQQELLVSNVDFSGATDPYRYVVNAYDSPDPINVLGDWLGTGVTSSDAIAHPDEFAVGDCTAADDATTFANIGFHLNGDQILYRPTVRGDANLDGFTDNADFAIWRNNFGVGDHWAQADWNYDEFTDNTDFAIWRNNFGAGTYPTY